MPARCMICGRVIEIKPKKENSNLWDDDDDFIPKPPPKAPSFCQLCEAKLRKEADDSVKGPSKPM